MFAFAPKNIRFLTSLDAILRLLAAWMIVRHQLVPRRLGLGWLMIVGATNGAIELAIFHKIFIASRVYDTVTAYLLGGLGIIPNP